MDKYEVLTFLIIYAICIAVTSVIFGASTSIYTWEKLPGSTYTVVSVTGAISTIFGLFTFDIPGVPLEVRFLFVSPLIIMLLYFIYLNLPKNPLLSSPNP